jgi:sensor histidine kinase YesM
MAGFLGGSAFGMARDIAEGYHLVTERTFKTMSRADAEQLAFELDRCLREARGEQAPQDDLALIKARNRKIQRLNQALMILRSYQQKTRRGA